MANATGSQVALWGTSTTREQVNRSSHDHRHPAQNAEPWKDYRSKEVAGYSGYDEIDHSTEEMNKLINEKVIRKTLMVTILKNGQPDLSVYGDLKHL